MKSNLQKRCGSIKLSHSLRLCAPRNRVTSKSDIIAECLQRKAGDIYLCDSTWLVKLIMLDSSCDRKLRPKTRLHLYGCTARTPSQLPKLEPSADPPRCPCILESSSDCFLRDLLRNLKVEGNARSKSLEQFSFDPQACIRLTNGARAPTGIISVSQNPRCLLQNVFPVPAQARICRREMHPRQSRGLDWREGKRDGGDRGVGSNAACTTSCLVP